MDPLPPPKYSLGLDLKLLKTRMVSSDKVADRTLTNVLSKGKADISQIDWCHSKEKNNTNAAM